jgi:hypothetical protein
VPRARISTSDTTLRVRGDKTGVTIEEYDALGVIQDFKMDPREAFWFADELVKAARVAKDAMLAEITRTPKGENNG